MVAFGGERPMRTMSKTFPPITAGAPCPPDHAAADACHPPTARRALADAIFRADDDIVIFQPSDAAQTALAYDPSLAAAGETRFRRPVFLAGHAHAVLSRSRQLPCRSPARRARFRWWCFTAARCQIRRPSTPPLCAKDGAGRAVSRYSTLQRLRGPGRRRREVNVHSPAAPLRRHQIPIRSAMPDQAIGSCWWAGQERPRGQPYTHVQLVPRGRGGHGRRSVAHPPTAKRHVGRPRLGVRRKTIARKPMLACSTTWWRCISGRSNWKGQAKWSQ